ncbi:sterile alpha motif domain-containing protein 3-like [Anneissia japonica]|uniref:sterile alpha motif domain-containing protein 3-like n=1 Tax=Anneissia japonica TaxID=1529436 RepID=UPI00142583FB|nr:sterile alpha motif domain-containing protein 3-like [Anneissia japonica]
MIRVHTMNPTKTEREHVCFQIVKHYPFLADTLGCGISSWQSAIKYRFKNLRKTRQVSSGNGTAVVKPEMKRRKCEAVETENGETDETCKEHVQQLKREMSKLSHRNYGLIGNLMEATYMYRRKRILENPVSINNVVQEYPALQLVSEIKAEFSRILGKEKIVRNMTAAFNTMQSNVFRLAMAKGVLKDSNIKNLVEEFPSRQSEIEGMACLIAVPILLRETGPDSAVLKICSENESIDQSIKESIFPRLVGSSSLEDIDPLYIAAEGKIISKLSGLNVDAAVAIALLMGAFYIFNVQYPNKSKNTYIFLESKILQNKTKEANRRVIVQKLLKELE